MDELKSKFNRDRKQQEMARQLAEIVGSTGTAQPFAQAKQTEPSASPGQQQLIR